MFRELYPLIELRDQGVELPREEEERWLFPLLEISLLILPLLLSPQPVMCSEICGVISLIGLRNDCGAPGDWVGSGEATMDVPARSPPV